MTEKPKRKDQRSGVGRSYQGRAGEADNFRARRGVHRHGRGLEPIHVSVGKHGALDAKDAALLDALGNKFDNADMGNILAVINNRAAAGRSRIKLPGEIKWLGALVKPWCGCDYPRVDAVHRRGQKNDFHHHISAAAGAIGQVA